MTTIQRGELLFKATIPGDPVAKGRHRCTCRGGKPRTYPAKKSAEWEKSAADFLSILWKRRPALTMPVSLTITAVAKRPQGLFRRQDPAGRMWKATKPDIDNIAKAVKDGLSKAGVIRDDNIVVHAELFDLYASKTEKPCVEVEIFSLVAAEEAEQLELLGGAP